MNSTSGPPGSVDIRDSRFRYTFADVAMRLAHDGPWYVVLAVILVLVLHGNTSTVETLNGLALALLARSKPPEQPDKANLTRGIAAALFVLVLLGAQHAAVSMNPQPLPPVATPAMVVLK